jgi:hypothetical protein
MLIYKKIIFLIAFFFILSCSQKTTFSGKIYRENINFDIFTNKLDLISEIGNPNYIDPIKNNYYYFTEKYTSSNLLNKKISERLVIVYHLDENDKILSLLEINKIIHKLIKKKQAIGLLF